LIVWLVFLVSVLHEKGVHSLEQVLLLAGICAAMVGPVTVVLWLMVAVVDRPTHADMVGGRDRRSPSRPADRRCRDEHHARLALDGRAPGIEASSANGVAAR
jgi:hypothetical protein